MPDSFKICFAVDPIVAREVKQLSDPLDRLAALAAHFTQQATADQVALLPQGDSRDLTSDVSAFNADRTLEMLPWSVPIYRGDAQWLGSGPRSGREPGYPVVDAAVLEAWAGDFARAERILGKLAEETVNRLLEQAATIMASRHQSPPVIRGDAGPQAAEYAGLYGNMATLIAERLHTHPRPDLPLTEQPAWILSEQLREDFGTQARTGLTGGAPRPTPQGARTGSRSGLLAGFPMNQAGQPVRPTRVDPAWFNLIYEAPRSRMSLEENAARTAYAVHNTLQGHPTSNISHFIPDAVQDVDSLGYVLGRGGFNYEGSSSEGIARIDKKLRLAGRGATAVIMLDLPDQDESCAINAFFDGVNVLYLDAQRQAMAENITELTGNDAELFSLVFDGRGNLRDFTPERIQRSSLDEVRQLQDNLSGSLGTSAHLQLQLGLRNSVPADPRQRFMFWTWLRGINGYPSLNGGRSVNCVECALSFELTLRGIPTVAAELNDVAEGDTQSKVEAYYGDVFSLIDSGYRGLGLTAARLRDLEFGHSAIVQVYLTNRHGYQWVHMFNMVHAGGQPGALPYFVDPQSGWYGVDPSKWDLIRDNSVGDVQVMFFDPQGRVIPEPLRIEPLVHNEFGLRAALGEPVPGADAAHLMADGSGFGASVGFRGVDNSSDAMRVARGLVIVPDAVERPVAARAEAARLIGVLLQDEDVRRRVAESDVRVVVIPRTERLTGVVEFIDVTTADNGTAMSAQDIPATARGWTDAERRRVAVSEENLLGGDADDTVGRTHPEGYSSPLHEFAHMVYVFGLTEEQRAQVVAAFDERSAEAQERQWVDGPLRNSAGDLVGNHSSTNAAEYFAQSVVAYFNANIGRDAATGQDRNNGADWIKTNDPQLHQLLHDVLGKPTGPLDANALSVTRQDNNLWQALRDHTALTELDHLNMPGGWRETTLAHGAHEGLTHAQNFPQQDATTAVDHHDGAATRGQLFPIATPGLSDSLPDVLSVDLLDPDVFREYTMDGSSSGLRSLSNVALLDGLLERYRKTAGQDSAQRAAALDDVIQRARAYVGTTKNTFRAERVLQVIEQAETAAESYRQRAEPVTPAEVDSVSKSKPLGLRERIVLAKREWPKPTESAVEDLEQSLKKAGPGSRSLVLEEGQEPVWAWNVNGDIQWKSETFTNVPPPQSTSARITSLDLRPNGDLIHVPEQFAGLGREAANFCTLNMGVPLASYL
ncbi:toxin glutamine deamidase domain-containing protein (plasmid) [Streptomyces sp. HUAS TT11]|uniref:toxin glutamine deamidase domain-containing protein n=1 Tax=Streptomyces sp. HUAS TT11 TaxID=3447508 RepID=UPI003F65DE65